MDFNKHDNIDRDVIEVSKDSLLLKIKGAKEFYTSTQSAWGFGGLALTLLTSAFLTESFVSILVIPGETIRMTFLALGVVCLAICVRNVHRWYRGKGKYDPEIIVGSLLQGTKPTLALPAPIELTLPVVKKTRVAAVARKKTQI